MMFCNATSACVPACPTRDRLEKDTESVKTGYEKPGLQVGFGTSEKASAPRLAEQTFSCCTIFLVVEPIRFELMTPCLQSRGRSSQPITLLHKFPFPIGKRGGLAYSSS